MSKEKSPDKIKKNTHVRSNTRKMVWQNILVARKKMSESEFGTFNFDLNKGCDHKRVGLSPHPFSHTLAYIGIW
jgi:hypothetical protein